MEELCLVPARAGTKIPVLTPWGRETYQVLLDQAPPGWVARIVTLPNRIWAQNGGREALKFYGATEEEAQSAAVRFIESECLRTGRRLATPPEHNHPEFYRSEQVAPRTPRRLLLRFAAAGEPDRAAVTANLSESGMFVITDNPAPVGKPVRIDLRTPKGSIRLEGEVVWSRQRRDYGRSLGFGVRLRNLPQEYLEQVRRMQSLHTD